MSYSNIEYIDEGPRRSGLAITAMILGLLSLFCLGIFAAIPALICGFIAMGNARRTPARYGGYGMAITGVITGFISLIASIGLVIMFIITGSAFGPALGRAREKANQAQDAAQLRHLAQIAIMSATENSGRFPANQRELFIRGASPANFISPNSGTAALRPPIDTEDPSFNIQLEAHSDYTYIGADLNLHAPRMRESEIIILYSRDDHLGGRNLAYADGKVEFVPKGAQLFRKFDESNRARAAAGLPMLALDGPPPTAPPIVHAPPGVVRPPVPVGPAVEIPRPNPIRTAFSNVDDALGFLNSARLEERRSALAHIQNSPVEEASRQKVAAQLERLLGDTFLRGGALQALKTWGSKDNAPAVRAMLPAGGRGSIPGGNQDEILALLVLWKDKESTIAIAQQLKNFFMRDDAAQALIAIGSDAEDAVQPHAGDSDSTTAKLAISVLAKIGTEKSLPAIHKGLYSTSRDLPEAASAALKEVGERLKLKPDQYMNVLLGRYTIDAPAGFTLDTAVDRPNTRQWSRQGAGRTVKSGYTVAVKIVPATHRINAMANAQNIETGTLSFKQISSQSTNAQSQQVYEALDGEYLIGLTVVLDNFDTNAKTSVSTVAKKIQIK